MTAKKVKLKNRRVELVRLENKDLAILFTRLDEHRNITKTPLLLSPAGAVALYGLLRSELNLEDLSAFEADSKHKSQ